MTRSMTLMTAVRDRGLTAVSFIEGFRAFPMSRHEAVLSFSKIGILLGNFVPTACLLYTSDAADE